MKKNKKEEKYKPKVIKYPVIRVIHNRKKTSLGQEKPNGGYTVLRLELEFGVYYAGISVCWNLEAYNKVKGKSIAFGRLMRALHYGFSETNSALKTEIEQKIRAQIGKVDEELFENARDGIKPVDPVKVYEYIPKEKA